MPVSSRLKLKRRIKNGDRWGLLRCIRQGKNAQGHRTLLLGCDGRFQYGNEKCDGHIEIRLRDFPGKALQLDCGCGSSEELPNPEITFHWGFRIDQELRDSIEEWQYHRGHDIPRAEVMRELLSLGIESNEPLTQEMTLGKPVCHVSIRVEEGLAGRVNRWAQHRLLTRGRAVVALMKRALIERGELIRK
jgi:hypothetical protein